MYIMYRVPGYVDVDIDRIEEQKNSTTRPVNVALVIIIYIWCDGVIVLMTVRVQIQ